MRKVKADFTALRVDFDVDVFKADKGVFVLAQDRPQQRGFLNFVSPAHSTKSDLLDYCKTNFDGVLRYLYPDRLNREYFEDGCSCIHTAKTLRPCPTSIADAEAVAFYEQNCKCSRNYVQS
jgi:hypothetical protein